MKINNWAQDFKDKWFELGLPMQHLDDIMSCTEDVAIKAVQSVELNWKPKKDWFTFLRPEVDTTLKSAKQATIKAIRSQVND